MGSKYFLILETLIDASHAVHENMRGNTGKCMKLGVGMIHAQSSKQLIDTKISTVTEVVGVSEYVPFKIHMIHLLLGQVYSLKKKVLYQDNKSALRMEQNGRNSCTGNSRHINVRLFFVKDCIDKGEFTIEHCPMVLILADYITKALQGDFFQKMRRVIMGWDFIDSNPRYITI